MHPVFKIKKAFLDRTKVVRFMDAKTRKAFNKYGGLVRTVAQRSMRSKKGASAEGSPPHAHGRRQLRKLLFYAYDDKDHKLVVGPVLLKETSGQKVPRTHEHGGSITRGTPKGIVTSYYKKRAYMRPAHDASVSKLPEFYS